MPIDYQKHIQRAADCLPCACGKRKHAKPQIPVSELIVREVEDQYHYHGERKSTVLCQSFECGVCHEVHKLARQVVEPIA